MDRGFTLLEVLVALCLLAGGLIVVAQLTVLAARASDASRETALATVLASQKIEQLRALSWGMAADGANSDDFDTDVAAWPDRPSGGNGLSPSAPGSLDDDTAGQVDYLDAAGRWLGSGGPAPGAAAFVRRWAVEASDASAPETLVLRVAVWRRAPPWAWRGRTSVWLPAVQFDTAKTRRGQ